jgi:hypothetical protein
MAGKLASRIWTFTYRRRSGKESGRKNSVGSFILRPHYQRSQWADTHTHKQERMRRPAAKKVDGTMCVLGRLKGKKEKNLVENFVLEMDGAVNLRVDCI